MPFIRRNDVSPGLRQKFESTHRVQLRQAMLNPGLSDEQRKMIKARLDAVGQDPVYRSDSPVKPGAIAFPAQNLRSVDGSQEGQASPDMEDLAQMKKADLVVRAQQLGLPTQGTKTELMARILALPAA